MDSDYSAPVIKVDGPLDIFKLTNFYCCRRTKEDNQTTTFDTIVSNKVSSDLGIGVRACVLFM